MVTLFDADGNEVEVDLPDPETPPVKVTPQWRKDLEAEAKAGKEALKELNQFKRAKALSDAGVDTKNPVSALFLQTYQGELTPEAIKVEAEKYGLLVTPAADPAVPDPQELQQFETFDQTGAYSRNPTAYDQANDAFKSAPALVKGAGGVMEWNYEGPQRILDIYAQAGGHISDLEIQGKVQTGTNSPPMNPGESAWPHGV